MKCDQAQMAMLELRPAATAPRPLAAHLATCDVCTAEWDRLQRTRAVLEGLAWPSPSASLERRLHSLAAPAPAPSAHRQSPDARQRGGSRGAGGAGGQRRLRLWPELAFVSLALTATALLLSLGSRVVPAVPGSTPTPIASPPTVAREPAGDVTYLDPPSGTIVVRARPATDVNLAGSARWTGDQIAACSRVWWDFGDGATESRPCPTAAQAEGYPGMVAAVAYDATHAFAGRGSYHPQLRMALADGQTVAQPTVTVLVLEPRAPDAWARARYWLAWLAVVATAFVAIARARRRPRRQRWLIVAVASLGLATFVPPFSYLPEPVGLLWAWRGGHSYDPRLPFADRFVIAGDPTAELRPYLDALIDQTGLDPLDPDSPLADYAFVEVYRPDPPRGAVFVSTRMTYGDGRTRTYDIPMKTSIGHFFAGWPWRRDGLGRLRTEHRALPGTPFAEPGGPQALVDPVRLPVDATDESSWFDSGCTPPIALVPSPDGTSVLIPRHSRASPGVDVVLAPLAGGFARTIGTAAVDYRWSPDSQNVVVTQQVRDDRSEVEVQVRRLFTDTPGAQVTLPSGARPGVTDAGVWYELAGALWMAPYAWRRKDKVLELPSSGDFAPAAAMCRGPDDCQPGAVVRPAPDGRRVAYSCRGGLCLVDVPDGGHRQVVALSASEVVWNSDGTMLVAVGRGGAPTEPSFAAIVKRSGELHGRVAVAPNGPVLAPAWTRDGRLVMTTCPFDGRRIITVDIRNGAVLDLSRPRWDAWAALMPRANGLLLSNGRGNLWQVNLPGPSATVTSMAPENTYGRPAPP